MRRLLMFVVLAIVLGGAVGTMMARDPGYVLITYAGMSFETSLWFALLALLVGYFLVRMSIVIWTRLRRGGIGVANWQQSRRARASQARTVRGLLLVGEGDWVSARKQLLAAVDDAATPLVNYVGAARAANELGDSGERDALLQKAGESTPGASTAIALIRGEMQLAMKQYPDALATLMSVKADTPNQPRSLRLLVQGHEQLGDWDALLGLAPELRKSAVLNTEELRSSLRRWWISWFDQPSGAGHAELSQQLIARWSKVDKDMRGDPELIAAYVRALIRAGAGVEAESTLSKALQQDWNEGLVSLYGRVRTDPADRQLSTAQGWQRRHPDDATLLLALGRIALANADSAKAREYFEASFAQQPTVEALNELARVCLAMGDRAHAGELLAQAMTLRGQPEEPMAAASGLSASARS